MAIGDFRVHPENTASAICALLSKHNETQYHTVKTLGGYKILKEGESLVVSVSYAPVSAPPKKKKPLSPADVDPAQNVPAFVKPLKMEAKKNPFILGPVAVEENNGALFHKIAKKYGVPQTATSMLNNPLLYPQQYGTVKELAVVFGNKLNALKKWEKGNEALAPEECALQKQWKADVIAALKSNASAKIGGVGANLKLLQVDFATVTPEFLFGWKPGDKNKQEFPKNVLVEHDIVFDGQVPVLLMLASPTIVTLKGWQPYVVETFIL